MFYEEEELDYGSIFVPRSFWYSAEDKSAKAFTPRVTPVLWLLCEFMKSKLVLKI